MNIDLNRLRVFAFVRYYGGVGAAAKHLHVTQSAVSQSLKKLELELGTLLFTRLHKELVPTREGEALFALVWPFLERLEGGVTELLRGQEGPWGKLRVGAPVEFGQGTLPAIFAAFRAAHPEVFFTLELGHPTVLLPALREGRLDFCFADIFAHKWELADALSVFAIESVFAEELILVGAREFCEAHGLGKVTLEALERVSFVAYNAHAPSVRSWCLHHLGAVPSRISLALLVESVRAVLEAIKHGMGLAIVPAHLVAEELREGSLCALRTDKAPMRNEISIVQLQDKVPSLTEKTFLSFCKKTLLT